MNDLLPYLILTVAFVIIAIIAGRMLRQRRLAQSAPLRISQQPTPSEDRCLLRADFNYTEDSPATSRVTITYYNGDKHRSEVLSNAMTQQDFNQHRAKLKREGWREESSNSDREGESYFFRRSKR